MVHVERTPLSRILRAEVYVNREKLPLRQIVETRKPSIAMTAVFYSPAQWAPVCPVKADGEILWSSPTDNYWALVWDVGPDVAPELVPPGGAARERNYVANCLLVRNGKPQPKLHYNNDVGGRRGRVAVGLTDTEWITYGATDGSSGAQTPEECRDYMAAQGSQFAIMMDGGSKVNLYVKEAGVMIEGKEPSQTLLLLYLDEDDKEEIPVSEKKTVCLDPGHDAGNTANKSPDGTYYEHEFCLDMGKRIKAHLERCGVTVAMTRNTGTAVTLANRCKIANAIQGLDLFVSLHSNAAAGSGWSSAKGWSTYIFSTGGKAETAAKNILKAVKAVGVAVRSTPIVTDPELYVLKGTVAPAVLIEHAFHTNQEDVANLKDDTWRASVAAAEAQGIVAYLGLSWVPEEAQEAPETPETPDPPEEPTELELAEAYVKDKGIMEGYADGDMHLDDPVTRKQLMLVAYRLGTIIENANKNANG